MAQWRHMATYIWDNIGSGDGLLPGGTKPLWFSDFHMRALSQRMPKLSLCIMSLKILITKILPRLPGANELSM